MQNVPLEDLAHSARAIMLNHILLQKAIFFITITFIFNLFNHLWYILSLLMRIIYKLLVTECSSHSVYTNLQLCYNCCAVIKIWKDKWFSNIIYLKILTKMCIISLAHQWKSLLALQSFLSSAFSSFLLLGVSIISFFFGHLLRTGIMKCEQF